MQPILLLAIAAVAVVAMGSGFLTNTITLTVQDLGVGEETLESPITSAAVDFEIARATDSTESHNVIDICKITVTEGTLAANSKVWCKLTDANGFVAAEGMKTVGPVSGPNGMFTIKITDGAGTAGGFANKVQNIHDVLIVARGP